MTTVGDFVATHRPDWQQLEGLLKKMKGSSFRRLTEDDVLALGRLYRQATSDLAVARRDYPYDRVTPYLNDLVGRAHPSIYRDDAMTLTRFTTFYRDTFPRAFRDTLLFTTIAVLMSVIPAMVCYAVCLAHPDALRVLLPGDGARLLTTMSQGQLWFNDGPGGAQSATSSFIMTNNIKVALIAFAGGALLGLLSIYVLVFNGIMVGGIAGAAQYYGLSLGLWSFIAAHGVLELSVIFISGGCGLQLGWAIVHPGLEQRGEAIIRAGRRALVLIIGAVPLLVIAGTLEGFLSPTHAPALLKLLTGLITGVFLYTYLFRTGRPRRRRRPTALLAVTG